MENKKGKSWKPQNNYEERQKTFGRRWKPWERTIKIMENTVSAQGKPKDHFEKWKISESGRKQMKTNVTKANGQSHGESIKNIRNPKDLWKTTENVRKSRDRAIETVTYVWKGYNSSPRPSDVDKLELPCLTRIVASHISDILQFYETSYLQI